MDKLRPSRRRAARSSAAASSTIAASSGARAGSVSGGRINPSSRCLRMDAPSKIVAGVGAVERFVAERKIGDDVALDGRFEQRPLKPGGIAQMAALDRAVRAETQRHENIAAESFDQGDAFP